MSDAIVNVKDSDFENEVLNSDIPVLVDFWAEWCGPCKMIAPILDELAQEFPNQLKVAKMDVDNNRNTPMKYSIRGIPTMILFKGGQLVDTKVGAVSKGQLKAFIEPHI